MTSMNDSIHSEIFSLSCCCIYNKRKKRQRLQAKRTRNFLASVVVFVHESNLFRAPYKCRAHESRNQHHTCC